MLAINGYLTHTISVPEVVWTAVTGIGLYFNFFLTKEAMDDLHALRAAKINSIREFAAISAFMSECLRLFIQFCLFALGLIAMMLPAPDIHKIPVFQWVLTTGFIIIAAVISGTALLERLRRKRLIELILEYEA